MKIEKWKLKKLKIEKIQHFSICNYKYAMSVYFVF